METISLFSCCWDKMPSIKVAYGREVRCLWSSSRYSPSWHRSQDRRSWKQWFMFQAQSVSRKKWTKSCAQLTFSTVYSPGSQAGNGATHSGRVFPPQKTLPQRHASRAISQMSLDSVKLTIDTDYHKDLEYKQGLALIPPLIPLIAH